MQALRAYSQMAPLPVKKIHGSSIIHCGWKGGGQCMDCYPHTPGHLIWNAVVGNVGPF